MKNELLSIMDEMQDIHKEVLNQYKTLTQKITSTLEWYAKNNSVPPIKGEITKGKIRWRGLVMVIKNGNEYQEQWIEQRGKIISPIIRIITKINII